MIHQAFCPFAEIVEKSTSLSLLVGLAAEAGTSLNLDTINRLLIFSDAYPAFTELSGIGFGSTKQRTLASYILSDIGLVHHRKGSFGKSVQKGIGNIVATL